MPEAGRTHSRPTYCFHNERQWLQISGKALNKIRLYFEKTLIQKTMQN
jgi:hypothetical protein